MDALLSICVIAHSSQTQTPLAPVGWLLRRYASRNDLVLQRKSLRAKRSNPCILAILRIMQDS